MNEVVETRKIVMKAQSCSRTLKLPVFSDVREIIHCESTIEGLLLYISTLEVVPLCYFKKLFFIRLSLNKSR